MAHSPAPQLVNRDKEMIPSVLIKAMFMLALCTVVLVGYATLTDKPLVGQPIASPVTQERLIVMAESDGAYTITDPSGGVIAELPKNSAGFISVVYAGLDRDRMLNKVAMTTPLTLAAYENGRLSLTDTASDWHVELGSFGASNKAAFAKLLD